MATLAYLLLCVPAVAAERDENAARDARKLHVTRGVEFVVSAATDENLLDELAAEFETIQQRLVEDLEVPPVEVPVRFYLFDTRKAFSDYVTEHVPSVQRFDTLGRHGIFLLRQDKPYVFLLKSDDLVRSLRHESVHVVLNVHHRGLPIWMDEGLAQCYEDAHDDYWSDRAAEVLDKDLLRRAPPKIDALTKLKVMSQLGPREYAGCWANVRSLLRDEHEGRDALRAYLAELRSGNEKPTLTVAPPSLKRADFATR